MAKESGALTVIVDDSAPAAQTISNDITTINFSTPRGVAEVTGVDAVAMERLLLLADMQVTLAGTFNDEADMSHAVFKTVSSTSVTRTTSIAHSGQTLVEEMIATDYALTRGQDGHLQWTVPMLLNQSSAVAWS